SFSPVPPATAVTSRKYPRTPYVPGSQDWAEAPPAATSTMTAAHQPRRPVNGKPLEAKLLRLFMTTPRSEPVPVSPSPLKSAGHTCGRVAVDAPAAVADHATDPAVRVPSGTAYPAARLSPRQYHDIAAG